MPYRSELKRPDLKGNFPCSVCGKMFCHSSSLSRHRMQAHFKSYTCTLCNQEINTNETLRSHMLGAHQVSRMFMCRCCNWAFPDKTSLHIHMQSMARNGTPGDVQVLAKSSVEEGDLSAFASFPPAMEDDDVTEDPAGSSPVSTTDSGAGGSPVVNQTPNIFPGQTTPAQDLMARIMNLQQQQKATPPAAVDPVNNSNSNMLAQWLANNVGSTNPWAAAVALQQMQQAQMGANPLMAFMQAQQQQQQQQALQQQMPRLGEEVKQEIHMDSSAFVGANKSSIVGTPKTSGTKLEMAVSNLMNRKRQGGEAQLPMCQLPVKLHSNGIHSPAGSTHSSSSTNNLTSSDTPQHSIITANPLSTSALVTSSSTSSSEMSPMKPKCESVIVAHCADCEILKTKLQLKSNNCRYLESKATSQESKVSRLEASIKTLESDKTRLAAENDTWRVQCDRLQQSMARAQEKSLLCLQNGGMATNPLALKGVFEELLAVSAHQHMQQAMAKGAKENATGGMF